MTETGLGKDGLIRPGLKSLKKSIQLPNAVIQRKTFAVIQHLVKNSSNTLADISFNLISVISAVCVFIMSYGQSFKHICGCKRSLPAKRSGLEHAR